MSSKPKDESAPAPVTVERDIDVDDAAHEELKGVALVLYTNATKAMTHGSRMEEVAVECFRRAKAFLKVSEGVKYEEINADPLPPEKPEFIDVPVHQEFADGKWKTVVDPVTNRPVMEKAPVDRSAYAPNLPETHPVNLRFRPVDKVPIALRKGTPQDIARAVAGDRE